MHFVSQMKRKIWEFHSQCCTTLEFISSYVLYICIYISFVPTFVESGTKLKISIGVEELSSTISLCSSVRPFREIFNFLLLNFKRRIFVRFAKKGCKKAQTVFDIYIGGIAKKEDEASVSRMRIMVINEKRTRGGVKATTNDSFGRRLAPPSIPGIPDCLRCLTAINLLKAYLPRFN